MQQGPEGGRIRRREVRQDLPSRLPMICGFGRANVGNQIDCVQVKLYLELQILLHPIVKVTTARFDER